MNLSATVARTSSPRRPATPVSAAASRLAFKCGLCPAPASFRALHGPCGDYAALLPIENPSNAVTLGEGATPLVEAPRLARQYGLQQLLLKNEMTNPTGSFKDRQISVGITRARELGKDTVAVVSSGNVACSAAAYAARAGMKAVLLMHGFAAAGKVAQATAYGRYSNPGGRAQRQRRV